MTGNILYYLTDHCEDTTQHETTLEGIRDYLRSDKRMPRAVTISVCYVPVIGFQPLVMDRVDVDTPAKPGAREHYLAAADLMNHLRTARNRLDILRSECSLSAAEQETVTIWTGEIDAIIAAHSSIFCGSRQQEPA